MKKAKTILALILALAMVFSLAGCAKKDDKETSKSPETTTPAAEDESKEPEATDPAEEENEGGNALASTPRNETLYFSGQQWGTINDWNPMSANSNNAMAIQQTDTARCLIYETLFMYNMLDGKLYGLLGDTYEWNDDQTELTITLKAEAKWSDGTQVTADDVAYTFDTHVKYGSSNGADYKNYIEKVEAVDATTVKFYTKLDEEGSPINPLKVLEYIPKIYVMQKAYLQKVEERCGEDPEKVKTDTMEDLVASGPYKPLYNDDQKVVFERDDNYWGQCEAMWGSLPAPKYIGHVIYKENNAGQVALAAGEVDVCQEFITDVQKLWEEQGLPISTYIDEAPYSICATMPTAFFNTEVAGLDNATVRKAIAWAVDYDQIIASAMSNQSPTFSEVPRSLMNPTEGEQALIDKEALKEYQFAGNDIDGANKLLDDAGILDTDGDGIRELNGQKLSFKAECPAGWSDWNASLEIVAAAGSKIGIEITTYFPDANTFYDDMTTGKFDICMWSPAGASIANPWTRCMGLLSSSYNDLEVNWSGNFGHFTSERADEILALIPHETDEAKLVEYYTELSKIYLDEVPSFSLMYRPQLFHVVNESVWTGYPQLNDGDNIPPTDCTDGYGIAALYNLVLVEN